MRINVNQCESMRMQVESESVLVKRLEKELVVAFALIEEYRSRCVRQRRVGVQLVSEKQALKQQMTYLNEQVRSLELRLEQLRSVCIFH